MSEKGSRTSENHIQVTGDGSHTLYSTRFDQHYHNPNGAVGESLHVFFRQNGLLDRLKRNDPLSVLEIGFGSGLNMLLLLDALKNYGVTESIRFYSIEAYPLGKTQANRLNFEDFLDHPELAGLLPDIFGSLEAGINRFSPLPSVELNIWYGDFDTFPGPSHPIDFIFHDPFSPDANPELWTSEVFSHLIKWSGNSAVLSTYCAASKARGAMAHAGWYIARARGALGKREMTLASPDETRLEGFKRINEQRMARRYVENDF